MKNIFAWFTTKAGVAVLLFLSLLFLVFTIEQVFHQLNSTDLIKNSDGVLLPRFDKLTVLPVAKQILSNFASGIFLILWWHLNKRFPRQEQDYALFFFSLAVLAWGLPIDFFRADGSETPIWFTSLYSTINNIFFFCAYRDLDHGSPNYNLWIFKRLGINKHNYFRFVGITGLFLVGLLILLFWMEYEKPAIVIDVLVSCIVTVWLFFCFQKAFSARMQNISGRIMAGYVLLVTGAMFASQLLTAYVNYNHITDGEIKPIAVLIAFTYNINFTLLLGVLAITWVLENLLEESEKAKSIAEREGEKAYFLKQDMIHVVRNSLDFFECDLEDLEKVEKEKEFPQPTIIEFFHKNAIRVSVLSEIFQEMHRQKTLQGVQLQSYLDKLFTNIGNTFHFRHLETRLQVEQLGFVPEPSAQKLAKILVELLMNSYKYGDKYAEVKVYVQDSFIQATVEDRGGGFEDSPKSSGFGTRVIEEYLITDLKGNYEKINLTNGTRIKLIIPLNKF